MRKLLLSPLIIVILIVLFGIGIAGAAIYIGAGTGGETNTESINLQKGLVGRWKFDGDAKDATPNSNNGTVSGPIFTTDRKGEANKAYSFDNTDDYINFGNKTQWNLASTSHTLTAWFKAPSKPTDDYARIFDRFTGGTPGAGYYIGMRSATGGIRIEERGTIDYGMVIEDSVDRADNIWHHIVYKVDVSAKIGYLYIDSAFITSYNYTGDLIDYNSSLWIGGNTDNPVDYIWNGSIDDVRIYNRALSQREITALYESYNPGIVVSDLQKGLVGNWKFDGNAKDSTPNGNNGTVYGPIFTTDRKGEANKAYSFNGTTDYLGADVRLVSAYPFTITAWAKKVVVDGGVDIVWIGDKDANDVFWELTLSTYFSATARNTTQYNCNGTTAVNDSNWHHAAAVYVSATERRIYTDGVLQNTCTDSVAYSSAVDRWNIGRRGRSIAEQYFGGSIDNVRIYNRVLSSAEILALYESYDPSVQVSNLQKGLIGHWKMDGDAKDATPYAKNGSVTGATLTMDRKGQVNKAYSFDGLTHYISMSALSSDLILGDFTISFWIYPFNLYDTSWAGLAYGSNYTYGFIFALTRFIFENTVAGYFQRDYTLSYGQWQHIVITHTLATKTFRFYKDASSLAADLVYTGNLVGTNKVISLAKHLAWGYIVKEYLDDLRIYNRVLSAAEITALYQSY